jgi:hypothetical protein
MTIKKLITEAQRMLRKTLNLAAEPNGVLTSGSNKRRLTDLIRGLEAAGEQIQRALQKAKGEIAALEHAAAQNVASEQVGLPTWLRVVPAPADPEPVLAWLAERIAYGKPSERYGIEDRTDPDDRGARERGATAALYYGETSWGRRRRETTRWWFSVGGELGLRLIEDWPRNENGGRKGIGAKAVAELVAGRAGRARGIARAEEILRVNQERAWRSELLSTALTLMKDPNGVSDFKAERRKADESDEGLEAALTDLSNLTGNPELATAPRRAKLIDPLARYWALETRDRARLAAVTSWAALGGFLREREETATRFELEKVRAALVAVSRAEAKAGRPEDMPA